MTLIENCCGVEANGIDRVPVAVVPSGAVAEAVNVTLVLVSPAGMVTSNWSGTVGSAVIVTSVSEDVSVGAKV